MSNESGTYFKGIYNDLVSRLPTFPSDDPSPNLQDCIKDDYVNFVRAEFLARQHNLSSGIITHMREMAILEYLIDYKNIAGLRKLMGEFGFSPSERSRIIGLIEEEKVYPCFSFSKHTEMAINESWGSTWRSEYLPIVEELTGKRASLLSRFITWLKGLFKKK